MSTCPQNYLVLQVFVVVWCFKTGAMLDKSILVTLHATKLDPTEPSAHCIKHQKHLTLMGSPLVDFCPPLAILHPTFPAKWHPHDVCYRDGVLPHSITNIRQACTTSMGSSSSHMGLWNQLCLYGCRGQPRVSPRVPS